jgi:undecaprenyl-diphosphatase
LAARNPFLSSFFRTIRMSLLQILVMGVVQGITEFLPISSDGHLVLTAAIFQAFGHPLHELLDVEIVLHAGTLATMIVFFWPQIMQAVRQDWRVIGLIVVGTIPAVLIGLPAKKFGPHVLESPQLTGPMLIVNGIVLLWAIRRPVGERTYQGLSWREVLIIGTAQALAILPGISRSGSTVAVALALGLRREAAANFSFLLGIPAIGGACTLSLLKLAGAGGGLQTNKSYLLAGAVVAFVVGLGAVRWLIAWLVQGRLHWFAYWCFAVGAGLAAWQVIKAFQ